MPDRIRRPLFVGLDVGTNATKCLVVSSDGRVVAQSRVDYGLSHPREGWVEQDPEALWQAVLAALTDCVQQCRRKGRIKAISLSSQGGTTIVATAAGDPLRPAISWLDTRAAAEGERIAADLGQAAIYEASGWEVGAYLPVVHISWLRAHEPQTYAAAGRYLFVNDFIIGRLTGRWVMDPSDAALTLLYNVAGNAWDDRLCVAAGVGAEQLSPIAESGTAVGPVLTEVAEAAGLEAGVLVVNGAHDQYCAALGAGVVDPGAVLLSCGTAWVLLAAAAGLVRDPNHTFAFGRHALPDRWGVLCSLSAAGASLDWLVREVISGPEDARPRYDLLDARLSPREPGAGGLLFLPYFTGIEVASRGTGLWGSLTGLTLSHSRWDVAQALMEGVALELRWVLERLGSLGAPPSELRMVGGATRSRVWPQIIADATGLPLALPDVPEGAARGAAMLAALGSGWFAGPDELMAEWTLGSRAIAPDPDRARQYDGIYRRFRAYDAAMRTMSEELHR